MAKQELLADDPRPLPSFIEAEKPGDEFIAVTGHHRKHGIRLLEQSMRRRRGHLRRGGPPGADRGLGSR